MTNATHKYPVPTGPFHSFQALPCPLPAGAQERLKTLSAALKEATANNKTDGPDAASARRLLADYIGRLRETIGEELIRREFVAGPAEPMRARKQLSAGHTRHAAGLRAQLMKGGRQREN